MMQQVFMWESKKSLFCPFKFRHVFFPDYFWQHQLVIWKHKKEDNFQDNSDKIPSLKPNLSFSTVCASICVAKGLCLLMVCIKKYDYDF